LSRRKNDSWVL